MKNILIFILFFLLLSTNANSNGRYDRYLVQEKGCIDIALKGKVILEENGQNEYPYIPTKIIYYKGKIYKLRYSRWRESFYRDEGGESIYKLFEGIICEEINDEGIYKFK